MKQNKTLAGFISAAGIILLVASLMRAISINNLVIGASTGDISRHFATSVIIDWILSCALLLSTGISLIFLAAQLRKGHRPAWFQAFVIGLVFSLFGSSLWYKYPHSLHLAGFLFVGLLIVIPLLIWARNFKKHKNNFLQ